MDGLLDAFIGAAITAVVGLAAAGVWVFVRKRVHVQSPLEALIKDVAEQVRCLIPVVGVIYEIQRPQLHAQAAILEAMKGEINGNVDRAHDAVMKAQETFDRFTNQAVMPECKEGVAA